MKLSNLLQSVTQNTASVDGVRWYPVRPITAENTFFTQRVKAAWRVLIGVSDAIEWDYPTDLLGGIDMQAANNAPDERLGVGCSWEPRP